MATSSALSSLLAKSTLDDHEEILKAANAALKTSKSDSQAQHAKLVALLKLDRYEEALQVLDEAGDSLKNAAPLEHAYTLYKNGQLEKAQEVASAGPRRRSLRHVEAQVTYRMERFSKARDIYKELSEGKLALEAESGDVRINSGATDAQLGWAGRQHLMLKPKPDRQDLEQFETAFNAACGYIAQGELKQASFLLGRAKDLCNAADELSEEDRKAELLPITVQQIYVLSRLGKSEEAEKLSSSINVNDISDKSTRHIAQANALFLSSNINPYHAHRLFHASSKIDPNDRLFKFQTTALHQDSKALDLQAGKTAEFPASSSAKTPKENSPLDDPYSGVFVAASHARNQTGRVAIKTILPLLEKHPEDVGLLLTVIQLYLLTNNASTAASLLESFFARLERSSKPAKPGDLDARFAPGLVALMVALLGQLNRTAHTKAELAKASSYWRHKSRSDEDASDSLLRAAGVAMLENPTVEEVDSAREIFQVLTQKDKSDRIAQAGLAACARSSAEARGFDERLPAVDKLTGGIDAAALEEAGVARVVQPTPSRKRPAESEAPSKVKAKKRRATKKPKNYDPNKQPDPERWLPLRDRSNWRPKGKKKGRAAALTQGGIVNEDSRPGTPQQQQQQQSKGGGQQKKKGKGK